MHLEKVGGSMGAFWAEGLGGGGGVPGVVAAEDVVDSLLLEVGNLALDAMGDAMDVWARSTLKAEEGGVGGVGGRLIGD